MDLFKKYVTCIMAFRIQFTNVTFCQFYSITSPVVFTKNNKLWNKRKDNFLYIWLLQCIKSCRRRDEIASLGTITFSDTHVCISKSH